MTNLRLLTLNVNGLGGPSKRRAIFGFLRDSGNEFLFIQETHSTRSREKIWSSEWGGRVFFSHGTSGARGVAILLSPSSRAVVDRVTRDPEGRFIILQARIDEWPVTLINVYAPTADHPDRQIELIDELEKRLHDMESPNIILGGDFNCYMEPELDRYSRLVGPNISSPTFSRAREQLKGLADELALTDIWRLLHPGLKQFTFRKSAYASRLDFWLISDHLTELAEDSKILPVALSDHNAVSLSIQTIPIVRGPGLWKFDNSLLLDSIFTKAMTNFLKDYQFDENLPSPHVQWDFLKYEIHKFCIDFASRAGSQLKSQISSLTRELLRMEEKNPASCPDAEELYRSKKKELAELEILKANKIIFRARANWAQQGERPSRYFLSLEKRRARTNTLSQALDDEGKLTSDPRKILGLTKSFYADLYASPSHELVPLEALNWQSLDIPQISKFQHDRLEEAYSEKELYRALQKLYKGKTPGTDGLSVDFYIRFLGLIKAPLLASIGYGLDSGELSTEQKRGVITLIPKKCSDRRRISNWRPISLLNTDNKILTKAMSLCLQPVLNEIIHPDQTGFLPKRYIGENLRTIQDVIDYTWESSTPALLLALDFRKAFDSVRWDFITRAFREFGFGTNFVDGIETIFRNIESCTANSGFTSEYFSPERGVRQGCCVSPYLFLLAVEVLGIQIRQTPAIKGVSVGDYEVKLSQFADDMTAFVLGKNSITAFMRIIDEFGSVSGLKINRDKSQVLCLGPPMTDIYPDLDLKVTDRTKILGVWFSPHRSSHDHYEWNYKDMLSKMRSTCHNWR